MKKHFNIAGPCIPGDHYMLPAQARCRNLHEIIDQKEYFVIHAARQSGKTTLLKELARQLNAGGQYYAVYCSLETVRGISDAAEGIPRILDELLYALRQHDAVGRYALEEPLDPAQYTLIVRKALSAVCRKLDKPLVLLLDEIDCLANGTLIGLLQQLRYGYVNRPDAPFAHSIALVGMRDIRDYKARIRGQRETLGSASPFNIITESLTLRNFMQEEIAALYAQHTEATGQAFPPEVTAAVFTATQGQPWLVNAIAREIVVKLLENDASRRIELAHVEEAVQRLILNRPTHIDSLMERLKEERVRRVIEPVILGDAVGYHTMDDDFRYVLDLGLLAQRVGKIVPSNPIYGEVILRVLSSQTQMTMQQQTYPPEYPAYLSGGRLDMGRLLRDFQAFWRENSAIWIEKYDYKEAAPHLILQAFLQRVINGGGRILREMAAGTQRLDLCVEFAAMRYPIELKLRYQEKTYQEGIAQLTGYMDMLGCSEGWLIVFDRRADIAWDEKLFWRTETVNGKTTHVIGC